VNDIMAFGSRMMSFGLRILCSKALKNNCYLYIELCLFDADLMLNLMISYRLANVICNG
jgi:hypothetical protein